MILPAGCENPADAPNADEVGTVEIETKHNQLFNSFYTDNWNRPPQKKKNIYIYIYIYI